MCFYNFRSNNDRKFDEKNNDFLRRAVQVESNSAICTNIENKRVDDERDGGNRNRLCSDRKTDKTDRRNLHHRRSTLNNGQSSNFLNEHVSTRPFFQRGNVKNL